LRACFICYDSLTVLTGNAKPWAMQRYKKTALFAGLIKRAASAPSVHLEEMQNVV
jgi:hypothetical protein